MRVPRTPITRARRRMLRWLDGRPRPTDDIKPGQVAMLRSMEEQGLVSRNLHGRWYINPAGREAAYEDEPQ